MYDSLGITERKKRLLQKYVPKEFAITFNSKRFQDINSTTCGKFILFYLINRFHNQDLPFQEVLNFLFKADSLKNEKKVENFLRKKKWTRVK